MNKEITALQHLLNAVSSKIQNYNTPLIISDLDGTLFAPDLQVLKTPFINAYNRALLKKKKIPLVVLTGRPKWDAFSKVQMRVIGLPDPDVIIIGLGTNIYVRNENGEYQESVEWQEVLKEQKWNKDEVLRQIKHIEMKNTVVKQDKNPYLLRVKVDDVSVKEIYDYKKRIESNLGGATSEVSVFLAENRWKKNTLEEFSGYIMIVPFFLGKDKMAEYVLQAIYSTINKPYRSLVLGDGLIDIPMLKMKSPNPDIELVQKSVSSTALTVFNLGGATPEVQQDGPTFLFQYLMNIKQATLSKAQNNRMRLIIQPIESVLDSLVGEKLSANQVSELGVTYMKQALQKPKNLLDIPQSIFLWIQAMSMDMLDGIRARRSEIIDEHGQLVDVFSDRIKEFAQLYSRAQKRQTDKQGISFAAAISCILPSLARAEAESKGVIVKELDSQGGSMLSRTSILLKSFVLNILALDRKSFELDHSMYIKNIATFKNRKEKAEHAIEKQSADELQQKGKIRFYLLLSILKDADILITKNVMNNKEYTVFSKEYLDDYLKMEIPKDIKQVIETRNLYLKNYID